MKTYSLLGCMAVLIAGLTMDARADLWADPSGSPARPVQTPTTKGDPVMTTNYDPMYSLYLRIIPESSIKGAGATDMYDIGGHWNIGYYRTRAGDWNIKADAHLRLFSESAEVALPSVAAKLFTDIGYHYRFNGTSSLETHLKPGLYSDLETFGGDGFSVPFSFTYAHVMNPDLTFALGAEFRPSWDRQVMPIVGLIWDIGPRNHLQIMLPDTRLSVAMGRNFSMQFNVGWENTDYGVNHKHGRDYKRITLEEYTMSLGLNYYMNDGRHVFGEFGMLFDRSVDFEKQAPSRDALEIEDEAFIRVGIGGPF